jgi:uncharacterized LabA/DUF88 family protein
LPPKKLVYAFFDGQNLFHAARESFGYKAANYDPFKLAYAITNLEPDRVLVGLNFYTGVHIRRINSTLNHFWRVKLGVIRRSGEKYKIETKTIHRPLKYIEIDDIKNPGQKYYQGREKGIDVRLSLDLVRLARYKKYDVAIIFSQDADLQEAVDDVWVLDRELGLRLTIECAFPQLPAGKKTYGIKNTKWRIIDKSLYDSCIDPKTDTYFPRLPMFKGQ